MAALLPNGLKRRLRDLALRGDAVHCPLCHRGAIAFLPSGTPPRPHALCPFCGSLERTRMMGLALKERGLPKPGHRVLHVAPDRSLREMLRKAPGVTYIAGDKQAPGYSYPQDTIDLDITALDFPDDHFDLIICSHVLEHVPEDRTAMRELCRVLRPGGTAILLVPMSDRPTTDEDPSVTIHRSASAGSDKRTMYASTAATTWIDYARPASSSPWTTWPHSFHQRMFFGMDCCGVICW
ncbi:MAG: class I SAM-dependent methyltransferase [Flavobacteriales bacterium]|nr:class I SAM-dependent methyltransferase [Flavobacteriales bacterium]